MSVTTLDRCQVGGQLIIDMCWGAHWALDPREVILKSKTRLSSIESQPKKVVVVVAVVVILFVVIIMVGHKNLTLKSGQN